MLKISDVAAEKAKEVLAAEGKESWGLRIYMSEDDCCGPSYGMDLDEQPAEGDEIVEKNGLKVFLDQNASQNLNGMEVDFIDDGDKQGFVITGSPSSSCSSGCSSCG